MIKARKDRKERRVHRELLEQRVSNGLLEQRCQPVVWATLAIGIL